MDNTSPYYLPSTPYISVVIVSWNALDTIKKCLPSVAATKHESFEILFVDNNSQDESVKWVRDSFPEIRIVSHPENWAYCKGNNQAVPHARGEVLVLLNNDVEVPVDWLNSISSLFQTDPTVAAAQPKILQFENRTLFEYAGAAGGFLDRDGYPFTRGRVFETVEKDDGQYDDDTDLFWASGTCLAVRKSIFEELGGFEESFFMHMEEIDLCWRIKAKGHRIALVPESRVYHIGGASLSNQSSQKQYLNFRNNLLMLYRNLPKSKWRFVLCRRMVLDSVAALRSFVGGKPRHGFAVFRAYRDAFRMKRSLQRSLQSTFSESQAFAPLPYQGSIVWDYFVKNRKRFSELPKDLFR